MALYFLLHDGAFFVEQARPALAAAWRQRTFEACRALCRALVPRARAFAAQYHLGEQEPLLAQVAAGLPFDRMFWQHLVGEVLWFGALDIPELQTAPDTLECLIAPATMTGEQTLVHQAHHGTRDLNIGGCCYRPDFAGWNDPSDVSRLAGFLGAVQTESWRPEHLATLEGVPAEDWQEELEYARDCLAGLRELYHRANEQHRIVVCETL